MDLGLMEKIALVAGGSRGCGYAIAEELASEGAKVVLSGRQVEQVEAAERALRDRGFVATGIAADMTTEGGCDAMVDVARKTYGDPDILVVNSPGPFPDTRSNRGRGFDNCADDLYAEVHNNFVLSQVRLARAVLPSMKEKRWGRLVNLGSIAMKVPHLEDPMPAVNTRVAVAALMKSLAQEFGPYGITANTIATGPFDSALSREYRASGTGVKTEDWYRTMLPVGRWGRPEEMGALVAFLCSIRAGFLTGETIRIDGGYAKSLF
ncbi:MAG: SDR family oxidoreductase [Rhizomicrobium sp.]